MSARTCSIKTTAALPRRLSGGLNTLTGLQQREHNIDNKRVEAKAAVPKSQGGGQPPRKIFVGGTVCALDAVHCI